MGLPRMTTRRWMIATAVVGLMMGGIVLAVRQREHLLSLSRYHAQRLELLSRSSHRNGSITWSRLSALRRVAKHHGDLHRKYRRAARYPWLPVEPDPPPPDP